MSQLLKRGAPTRRCYCRDASGKVYGSKCPRAGKKGHGVWIARQELYETADGQRRRFRRSGFETKDAADEALDHVWDLLKLAGTQTDRDALSDWLERLSSTKEDLPSVADVRLALKTGDTSGHKPDVAELFDIWLPLQTHLRRVSALMKFRRSEGLSLT